MRGRASLLGLFVLFQVIYLPLSNLVQIVPREMYKESGELDIRVQREGAATDVRWLQDRINNLGWTIDRYSELSGQKQAWSLFAPEFTTQSIFPVVLCESFPNDKHRRVIFKPKHFPSDPDQYFYWPNYLSRLCAYDYLLAVVYARYTEESGRERPDQWRQTVFERVRRQQRSLEAYFRLNLAYFRESYPDLPTPKEMILRVAVFPSPQPGGHERPPMFMVPLARWVPDKPDKGSYLPVEPYDHVLQRFVPLEKEVRGR